MTGNEVRIKRVTIDDYEHVKDILCGNDAHKGTDYLPDFFLTWMNMASTEAYTSIIDGQFVCFVLLLLVDDGKTVVTMGSRTRAEFEGKGLYRSLKQYLENIFLQRRSLLHHAFSSVTENLNVPKELYPGEEYTVFQKDFRTFRSSNTTELRENFHKQIADKSVEIIDEQKLGKILSSEEHCAHYFEERRVVVNYIPYRLIPSNAGLMKTERTTIAISDLHEQQFGMLSFVSVFRGSIGLVWNLDIYGQINSKLIGHLLLHYRNNPFCNNLDRLFIRCCCTTDAEWSRISRIMRELGLEECSGWGTGIICRERKFHKSSKL